MPPLGESSEKLQLVAVITTAQTTHTVVGSTGSEQTTSVCPQPLKDSNG